MVGGLAAFVFAHGEEGMVCCHSQQLQLQYVTPHVPPYDEQDFPPLHFVEVFAAVAAYLAHYSLEEVVGCGAFGILSSLPSSISGLMTLGTSYHLLRSSMMAVSRSLRSAGVASYRIYSEVTGTYKERNLKN